MSLPPFPEDVPTHPLLVVDYQKLVEDDAAEIGKIWQAATTLGFWYLKNHGVDDEVDRMFSMGEETMSLPLSEKMAFEQDSEGITFGYKAFGANTVDELGNVDTVEYMDVSQDDALAWPETVNRTYPRTVNERMVNTIVPFVKKTRAITVVLLKILERKLGLPEGELVKKHSDEELSANQTRCIKSSPRAPGDENKIAIGGHTDSGSLSFLHNRLGGLQVMVPGTEEWQYVKPIPGHAICNLGDAMAIFSGGVLRSNLHRVVQPPGEQSKHTRWSLVLFTRPGHSMVLEPMAESSDMVAEAIRRPGNANFKTGGVTAREWFERRIKGRRVKNWKGPESWRAGRGTEHNVSAY